MHIYRKEKEDIRGNTEIKNDHKRLLQATFIYMSI